MRDGWWWLYGGRVADLVFAVGQPLFMAVSVIAGTVLQTLGTETGTIEWIALFVLPVLAWWTSLASEEGSVPKVVSAIAGALAVVALVLATNQAAPNVLELLAGQPADLDGTGWLVVAAVALALDVLVRVVGVLRLGWRTAPEWFDRWL